MMRLYAENRPLLLAATTGRKSSTTAEASGTDQASTVSRVNLKL